MSKFSDVFKVDKPIIGMIHCYNNGDVIGCALKEIEIYEEEGVDGYIVENYFGSAADVWAVLLHRDRSGKCAVGVNILPNEFEVAFNYAYAVGGNFIQVDCVGGKYIDRKNLNKDLLRWNGDNYPDIISLGGVWPKYYFKVPDSDLEADIREAESRVDAIVVTGDGTGHETPINKIKSFRELTSYPLIIGAGLTVDNAKEQLSIGDGAIVGSYFKEGGVAHSPMDRKRVRDLMDVVKSIRKNEVAEI